MIRAVFRAKSIVESSDRLVEAKPVELICRLRAVVRMHEIDKWARCKISHRVSQLLAPSWIDMRQPAAEVGHPNEFADRFGNPSTLDVESLPPSFSDKSHDAQERDAERSHGRRDDDRRLPAHQRLGS